MRGVSLPVMDDRASPERLGRALRALGIADVRTGRHERMLYATDASIFQVEPLAVVVVGSEREAELAVAFCRDQGLPLLPRGGGTALAGQTVNRAVVLDFSAHCRRILSVDQAAKRAWVEPGVVLDQFNAHLAPMGLMFGPDVATSSHANLGGMIGNNSAGAYSVRYGRTVEHLHGLVVLLPDGTRLHLEEGSAQRDPRQREMAGRLAEIVRSVEPEIDRRFPKIRRHVDGYNLDILLKELRESTPGTVDRVNLAHLVCGSEGTLAVTLRAELRLVDRPAVRGLAIAAFRSVDAALESLLPILGQSPAAVEMVDDVVIQTALLNREHRATVASLPSFGGDAPGAVLYVEHFGATREEVEAKLDGLAAILPGAPIERFLDPAAMLRAWRLRKAGEPLLHAIPGERKPITFVEDTAGDPSRLREFVHEFRAIVEKHGTRAAYWAHASVGCLHIRPLVDVRSPDDRRRMVEIAEEVAALVHRYGGALSGEHGDGRVRTPLLERVMGAPLIDAFRRVKAVFDPQGRMNPGNIVGPQEPARILEHHRVRPQQAFTPLPAERGLTYFRYDREGGFGHAIEQCNGAGICRRMSPGAMCPSYRATLDERHATRGRGNALRLAITGQFGEGAPSWRDPETLETLRLCLSCKACKSECPSNVDIAKLKAEYLAHSYRESGGVPFKAKFFGRVRRASRAGSALWPLANAVLRSRLGKAVLASVADIDPRREMPTFAPSLLRWARKRQRREGRMGVAPSRTASPPVLLFADCFTAFQEPWIGEAAVEVLDAFGYRVEISDAGCCGRALLSTGMLAEASRTCAATARNLRRDMERHRAEAVVVCEPSCLSALTDDWRDLRMAESAESINALADRCHSVDGFLDRRWDHHPRRPAPSPSRERLLVHAHCHQRALEGGESAVRLLRRFWPDRVELLDSGCCGMAGSFGFTRDRYDLSMAIGEQSLFARLRERGVGAEEGAAAGGAAHAPVVVAAGTSCRHQVAEGVGAEALHPVDLLRRILRHDDAAPSR